MWTVVYAVVVNPLTAEVGHPCAGTLGGTREKVGVEHSHKVAFFVGHVKRFDLRVIDRVVLIFCKFQSVQTIGKTEGSVNHVVKFEIRAQVFFAIGILLIFQLVGIVRIVPCL